MLIHTQQNLNDFGSARDPTRNVCILSAFSDLLVVGCKLCTQACKLQKQLTHCMEERHS